MPFNDSPNKRHDASDITDEDCEDVDEMMIVSENANKKKPES